MYVYGRLAYLPSLSDLKVDDDTSGEGDSGYDVEIGLGFEPIPALSLWVGYRANQFDFSNVRETSFESATLENAGPFIGAGIHF